MSYRSRPFDLIHAWEIKDFFEAEPPHSPGQVRCEAFSRTADSLLVGEFFLALLPIEFVNGAMEGSVAGRLVALLQQLKTEAITVESALQDELFKDMRKREPPLAGWHHNDFLGGAGLLPPWALTVIYRGIDPKCLHYYVAGGPYDAGDDKVLNLKPVWLVYERCPGPPGNGDAWNRTVRLAVDGVSSDYVAVYMCPIYNTAVPWFDLLDQRWCLAIRSSSQFHLNGRMCEQFDAWIACATRRIGCYINHVSQRAESLKSDVWRRRKGCPKSQNCAVE